MNTPRKDGFTLVELLIVTVVIGLLAAIAIPKFQSVREKAFLSTVKADLRNLANLQANYYNDNFTYSTDATALGHYSSEGVVITIAEATSTGWSASGTHLGIPTESCAIYHGGAAQLAPANVESTVLCSR